MKKTFTKLFSVIMIILFSSLGVKSQNVEIGYKTTLVKNDIMQP